MSWNDSSRISSYVSSKGFVQFIQPEYYDPKNEKTYTGYVALRLTCRTDIYIGSGFSVMPENSNQLVYQTMLYDGKPVIPGSSFKGVVRNIASAASNGCLPQLPRSKGGPPARYSRFLGYDKGAKKYTMIVNEEQAVTVRRIFRVFLQGYTPHTIASLLTEDGIPSPCGCDSWSGMTVRRMLSNEKYKGDALLQKQFTVQGLPTGG